MVNERELARRIDQQIARFGSPVGIKKYFVATHEESLYDEMRHKEYQHPIFIKAIVLFDPSEDLLNEAGMTKDEAEVIVKIPTLELRRKKLLDAKNIPQFNQDDLLVIGEEEFRIKKVMRYVHYKEHWLVSVGAIRA